LKNNFPFRRPIHSSRSVGGPIPLHQSQSLTLAEFHELLLRIQQEMQTRQHLEGIEQQRQQQQLNTSTNWGFKNNLFKYIFIFYRDRTTILISKSTKLS